MRVYVCSYAGSLRIFIKLRSVLAAVSLCNWRYEMRDENEARNKKIELQCEQSERQILNGVFGTTSKNAFKRIATLYKNIYVCPFIRFHIFY